MSNEERSAACFLPPTATGQQALLVVAPGTGVQDLNALWGGTRDRWASATAYVTIRSEGGITIVRFLFAGETGGAAAGNAITIADGTSENFLVSPGTARLDFNVAGGAMKLWKSSIGF